MTALRLVLYGNSTYINVKTEDKYCGEDCAYKRASPLYCVLFDKKLNTCLGGGPLRCAACLEAEKNTKEKN